MSRTGPAQADATRGHRAPAPAESPVQAVLTHLHRLVRKEIALVRADVMRRVDYALVGVVCLLIAVLLLLVGLNVLAGAATALLVEMGLTAAQAALAVGGTSVAVAVILCLSGLRRLKTITAPRPAPKSGLGGPIHAQGETTP